MREFGSEFEYVGDDGALQNIWNGFSDFKLLRCGRDAVTGTAIAMLKQRGIKTVWVPALSCISMYGGFISEGFKVNFYPIDERFNPLLDEKNDYKNSVVLFMLYYGVTDINAVGGFISNHKECVSVVDITHAVWNEDAYSLPADAFIGSIRKSVGVVNGGIFLSNKFSIEAKTGVNKFTRLREGAFGLKNIYNDTRDENIKNEYRKMFSDAELSLISETGVYCADNKSVKTLLSLNTEEIKRKRISNFNKLSGMLQNLSSVRPLCAKLQKNAIPFSLPVLVDNQSEVQLKLAKQGVYAPVLWPIDEKAKKVCKFSDKVSQSMLSLPIDQRYTADDMDLIFERLQQAVYD